MPSEIFIMVMAFVLGSVTQFLFKKNKLNPQLKKIRTTAYQAVVLYLLFKIGFIGGKSISSEPVNHIILSSSIAVIASITWTMVLLQLFRIGKKFDQLTRISLATHFGSVSVGTFIAGQGFLSSLGVEISSSIVIWLATMELPALFVGVLALRIGFSQIINVLKKDTLLWVLLFSIILGSFTSTIIPNTIQTFLFSTIFLPLLAYFLFEMGSKAATHLQEVKNKIYPLISFGIGIPIIGGTLSAVIASFLQYSISEAFMFSILMASASYVLIPISLKEIFKKSGKEKKSSENAIATSMAISIGVTLPFNILIGFKFYYWLIQVLQKHI